MRRFPTHHQMRPPAEIFELSLDGRDVLQRRMRDERRRARASHCAGDLEEAPDFRAETIDLILDERAKPVRDEGSSGRFEIQGPLSVAFEHAAGAFEVLEEM